MQLLHTRVAFAAAPSRHPLLRRGCHTSHGLAATLSLPCWCGDALHVRLIHHSYQAAGRYAVVYEVQDTAAVGSSAKLWKGRPFKRFKRLQVSMALPAGRSFRVRADFALYDAPVTSTAEPLALVEVELEPCNGQSGP